MTQEQRKELDNSLELLSSRAAELVSPTPSGRPRKVPSWWRGAEAATASNLAAARSLGYSVGQVS